MLGSIVTFRSEDGNDSIVPLILPLLLLIIFFVKLFCCEAFVKIEMVNKIAVINTTLIMTFN